MDFSYWFTGRFSLRPFHWVYTMYIYNIYIYVYKYNIINIYIYNIYNIYNIYTHNIYNIYIHILDQLRYLISPWISLLGTRGQVSLLARAQRGSGWSQRLERTRRSGCGGFSNKTRAARGNSCTLLNVNGNSRGYTLWLCQNSYWKWPFIMDFPIKNGDFP